MRTPFAKRSSDRSRTILVIDIGGTQVKLKLSTRRVPCEFNSGPKLTARTMVKNVEYDQRLDLPGCFDRLPRPRCGKPAHR